MYVFYILELNNLYFFLFYVLKKDFFNVFYVYSYVIRILAAPKRVVLLWFGKNIK